MLYPRMQACNNLFSPYYFVNALASQTDAVAGFVDAVLRQPGDDLCQRGKHDVFTNYSHRF